MKYRHTLFALTAGVVVGAQLPVFADDAEPVQARSAKARAAQADTLPPAPVPASPTPIDATPNAPLPPEPMPDQPVVNPAPPPSNSGGGAPYRGPLGADYRRTPPPKKQYLGDEGGLGSKPALEGSASSAGTDRYGIAPPPGTLGRTYQQRSRLIDDEKHPRMAAVDVYLSENYDVSAKGLKSTWTGKVWHLSTDTLLPGTPHIYEVKAEWGPEGAKKKEVRTVRLIMNRVVDLEF